MLARLLLLPALAAMALTAAPRAQAPAPAEPVPEALARIVATEQEFAARARAAGWKAAFLEFFAPDAIGFTAGQVGFARDQIAAAPDPPPDLQVIWEPRSGDVAAAGDLGYLIGPARRVRSGGTQNRPQHLVYASIWKRQRDGTFRVVMDAGVPAPGPASFPPGFSRAPVTSRFTADYDDTTPPLGTADGLLNTGLRTNQVRGYRAYLMASSRLHRPTLQPLVGERRIQQWLATQASFAAIDTRFSESARSGDLGYTWGTYRTRASGPGTGQEGFYVRVWVRERTGQWRLALDVLQPQ